MKYALDALELLQDTSIYCIDNWLRVELSTKAKEDILMLNGAASFLLDHELTKENAGKEITNDVASLSEVTFTPARLMDVAIELSNRIKELDFSKETTKFGEYYNFISETEEYVKDGLTDYPGKLALAYIEKLVEIVCVEKKTYPAIKVGEVIFLNLTEAWRQIYMNIYGPKFRGLSSAAYFTGVAESAEMIRGQILD